MSQNCELRGYETYRLQALLNSDTETNAALENDCFSSLLGCSTQKMQTFMRRGPRNTTAPNNSFAMASAGRTVARTDLNHTPGSSTSILLAFYWASKPLNPKP